MAQKGKRRWINALKLDEGSFSAKARKAGKTTSAYAQDKKHAPGRLGKQARLALVFSRMNKKKMRRRKKR